ncbi:hypothetical protein [Novosphingobium sp. BW1]|uniref:hypothetical protein n=1 Tax=Novosphingobium sp. BW1 TaxID=2592621 RepID=UPI0011DEB42D|nr:hypothetical protein [Novosphingobium sp. BW1]TYC89181.1 hypothetical protein FMM79_10740 [Novosphingobium sp. BW1]
MDQANRQILARGISTVGHPAIVLPTASVVTLAGTGEAGLRVPSLILGLALVSGLLLWSWKKVRHGHWRHFDASALSERAQWNRQGLLATLAAAITAAFLGDKTLAGILAASTSIFGIAWISGDYLKLSQHVAFAILAAGIYARVHPELALIQGLLTATIAWSRLELARHGRLEILAGVLTGILAACIATLWES